MQLSVFNDLCLICAKYDCEQESYHKKYCLKQMEKLLGNYFLLEVFCKKKDTKSQASSFLFIPCKNNQNVFHENLKNDQNETQKNKNLLSIFISKVLFVFEKIQEKNNKRITQFFELLLASLSTIYFLQAFDSDPLLFHDILYVVKMMTLHKYKHQQKIINNQDFPFTQNRIKRTIKILEQRIFQKKSIANLKRTNASFSSNYQKKQFPLNDITNYFDQRVKFKDSQKINEISIGFSKENEMQQQINEDISLRNLAEQLPILLEQNRIVDKELEIYFIHRFLVQIEKIQLKLTQSMSSSSQTNLIKITEMNTLDKKNHKKSNKKIIARENKSIYPITEMSQKERQNIKFQEDAEMIEFTFIEGVPFPKNRRSIDFSILQITDKVFILNLPSLEKLKDLQQLCIRKNHLTGLCYKILKNSFPQLRSLDVRQNTIGPQISQLITQFKSLNILYISECHIQSKSLIQICLKLDNLNVLYCDNLVLLNEDYEPIEIVTQKSDMRGIFYIMVLNLKKLMYFSIKGYFPSKLIDQMFRSDITHQSICLTEVIDSKELKIFRNIYRTLQKRHGVVEI